MMTTHMIGQSSSAHSSPKRVDRSLGRAKSDHPRSCAKGTGKLRGRSSSSSKHSHRPSNSSQSDLDEQGFLTMPQYERWSRSDLENESERLGYEDGLELSTAALVARAEAAWTNQMGCRPHTVGIMTRTPLSEPGPSVAVPQYDSDSASLHDPPRHDNDYDNDNEEQEQEQEDRDFHPSDRYHHYGQEDDDLAWENNLLNPEDHELFVQSDLASKQGGPLRPFFESFAKPKLEEEYAKLARKIEATEAPASSAEEDPLADARNDLDKVPKTKAALAKKVLRLWNALYPPNPLVHSLNSTGTASLPKSSVKIVKEKLDFQGLHRLMLLLLTSREPELYLRILRFEPIQLSVFEDKVKNLLEEEFEDRFKAQLLVQQSQQQRPQAVEGEDQECVSKSSSDTDDDDDQVNNDGSGCKKKKLKGKKGKKAGSTIVTVTKQVLQTDTLTRWLDFQAVSYFLLVPTAPRRPRY